MTELAATFNRSEFSCFLNSSRGRGFRLLAGTGFLFVGLIFRVRLLGVVSIVWSVFPLSAGALDICYINAALGGPLAGSKIRSDYQPN
jgi:hypothetical protein